MSKSHLVQKEQISEMLPLHSVQSQMLVYSGAKSLHVETGVGTGGGKAGSGQVGLKVVVVELVVEVLGGVEVVVGLPVQETVQMNPLDVPESPLLLKVTLRLS